MSPPPPLTRPEIHAGAVVDAQVHLWQLAQTTRPHGHRFEQFGPEDALAAMDSAGVDRAVLIPPSFAGDDNGYCLAAAAAYPERFTVAGRIDLDTPLPIEAAAEWYRQPGMSGARLTFGITSQTRRPPTEDRFAWFWDAAEAAGMPVMVHAPGQLEEVRKLAERWAGLRLCIDHAGLTGSMSPAEAAEVLAQVPALADLPNLSVKASSLPCFAADAYPFRSLAGHIEQMFDAFGPRRMFWGTDLTRIPCGYREAVSQFSEHLEFLSGRDKKLVMGDALLSWLSWS